MNGGLDPASKLGVYDVPCGGVLAVQAATTLGAVNFFGTSTAASGLQRVLADTVIVAASAQDQAGGLLTTVRNADLTLQTLTNCLASVPSTSVVAGNFIRLDNRAPSPSLWDPTAPGQGATVVGSSVWLGSSVSFPTTPSATNGLTLGVDVAGATTGAGNVTTTWQYAPAGTAKSSAAWTAVNASSTIPESGSSSAYNLRLITRDAIGNADTSLVGIAGSDATFGVDLHNPTATVRPEAMPIASAVVSNGACADNRIPGSDATHPGSCAAVALPNGAVFSVTGSDPPSANGNAGSGLGPAPLNLSIRGIRPSGAGQASFCGIGQTPAPANDPNCATVVERVPLSVTLPTTPGEYRVAWTLSDQANNKTAPSVFQYYIDNTPPVITGAVTVPSAIAGGAQFTVDGLTDDMDVVGVNGALNYPGAGVRILYPGTLTGAGGAAIFDSVLARAQQGTVTLSTFYRTLTPMTAGPGFGPGGKPDQLRVRAVDGARNLSLAALAPLSASSITGTGVPGYTLGVSLTDFQIQLSNATVNGSGTGGTRSTTITAHTTTPLTVGASPFSEVCFYYANHATFGSEGAGTNGVNQGAAGELVLIGCSSTVTASTNGSSLFYDFAMPFDPPDTFDGPLAGGLTIRAIGVNISGDALLSMPVVLTVL